MRPYMVERTFPDGLNILTTWRGRDGATDMLISTNAVSRSLPISAAYRLHSNFLLDESGYVDV